MVKNKITDLKTLLKFLVTTERYDLFTIASINKAACQSVMEGVKMFIEAEAEGEKTSGDDESNVGVH